MVGLEHTVEPFFGQAGFVGEAVDEGEVVFANAVVDESGVESFIHKLGSGLPLRGREGTEARHGSTTAYVLDTAAPTQAVSCKTAQVCKLSLSLVMGPGA